MTRPPLVELGQGRYLADLAFRGIEGLVGCYLLPQSDGWTAIETGPTTCRDRFLANLEAAGIDRAELRRVFVTHIHLDHAGGVGALQTDLPKAEFFVHSIGLPHLVEPTRLAESARRAWGARSDVLWGSLQPADPLRIHPLSGGERFDLLGGSLEVISTPGHARHHLAFLDTGTGGLMTGDGAGVRLVGAPTPRPALPPPDLDLEELFRSLEAMAGHQPRRIFYTHFGESPDGPVDLARYRANVERWRDVALAAARAEPTVASVTDALRRAEGTGSRAPERDPSGERVDLISSYDLAAQGLLRYFQRRGLLPG